MYFVRMALLALGLCLVGTVPATAQNGCQSTMRGEFRVMEGLQFLYGGDAVVTSCNGVWITFEATGRTFDARELFTPAGFDYFAANLEFIAQTFVDPVPEEFQVPGVQFLAFPLLEYITTERSELAIGGGGVADTIVFRWRENDGEPRIMLLQFYEVSGAWFGQREFND